MSLHMSSLDSGVFQTRVRSARTKPGWVKHFPRAHGGGPILRAPWPREPRRDCSSRFLSHLPCAHVASQPLQLLASLRRFVFPNAVICVASEHEADLPRGAALLLGKLGSAGQRKCAGSRGNAGVCGPGSQSSSAVGVAGPDTTRPHAQLSSQVGPCVLITLLHVPAAPSFVELSGDHCGAPSSVGRCPASLGCLPHFPFSSNFLTFFRLKAYTVLLLTHLWKW